MSARMRGLAKLAAAVGIAAWLAPFAAQWWWPLELPSHFKIQHAAVLLLFAPVFWALREPRWVLAIFAVLALDARTFADYWPGDFGARTAMATRADIADPSLGRGAAALRPPVRLKVMTANIWRRDIPPEPLLELIETESPDVLFLQEYTHRWAARLAPLDAQYPYSVKHAAGGPFGIAVFSRHKLEGSDFPLSSMPAVEAQLRIGGRTIALVGVHLRTPTSVGGARDTKVQLELLAELRARTPGPLLIAGDFNNTPFSPTLRRWLDKTRLEDPRREHGHGVSWPTFLPMLGIPIDHVFVSDELIVTDYRRLPSVGSDHYPMIAEILLP